MGVAHRLRCITVKVGLINECPDCGHVWITDFSFDLRRDPSSGEPIVIDTPEAIQALKDIAPVTGLPCLPSCEERAA